MTALLVFLCTLLVLITLVVIINFFFRVKYSNLRLCQKCGNFHSMPRKKKSQNNSIPLFPPIFTSTPETASRYIHGRRKVHFGPSDSLQSLIKENNEALSRLDYIKEYFQGKRETFKRVLSSTDQRGDIH